MIGKRFLRWAIVIVLSTALFASCTTSDIEQNIKDDLVSIKVHMAPLPEVEEEVYENPWMLTAGDFSMQIGERIVLTLPPGNEEGTAWGTDVYTDDSNIGLAAVHSSLITFEDGGTVIVEIRPGQNAYTGSSRNGVTTLSYGEWESSFIFIDE
ncbi:MAG: LCCL domain-containing protein [Sphaerochaeta sp.]